MSIFSSIKVRKPKKSKFDLSHERKMSIKMGKLYPILLQEIVPGDSFKVKSEILARLAPMISPVMHRINVNTHYFFVPNRLVWDEWQDFITGGEDGEQKPPYPTIDINPNTEEYFIKGKLPDYFGIPIATIGETGDNDNEISALPFRAYALIYNEYFRDQNLEEKIEFDKTSGQIAGDLPQIDRLTTIRQRPWAKDYFTSALPTPQRGGEATMPMDVQYKNVTDIVSNDAGGNQHGFMWSNNTEQLNISENNDGTGESNLARVENLEDQTLFSINDLRKATRLQEWLEKSARGGSRYIEQIFSHFGVKSSDSRLQRPELLGSGSQPIVISEVLQTSETDPVGPDASPQGNMAGHGISVGKTNGFTRTFEEHGYVIGVMSVLPKTTYQQGIERHFTKFDKFDYYWPEFANLGEQEILNKEIFMDFDQDAIVNEETWGYQQRYAEYKYQQSSVHGDFRDSSEDLGLNFWHMGRIFPALPPLNENFIHSDPTTRIFAVTDEEIDTMYVQIYNKISALRPMPYHSIPSL